MWLRAVQIGGALLALAGAGCAPSARCLLPRARPEMRPTPMFEGTLKFDPEEPTLERIVVARVPLPAGTPLRASLLQVVTRPRGLVWAGHLRPVDLVHFAGRRLRRAIPAGQPVTRGDLAETGAAPRRVGVKLPPGGRAAILRVDWVGGAGTWVRPGDHVDVAVMLRARGRWVLRMLMQSARVLSAERWPGKGAPSRRPWCSLLALPREAQALALAQRLGRIVLIPRAGGDRRRAVYPPVTRRDLEDPRFWRRLRQSRLRTIQRLGLPDDPGIGPGIGRGLRPK
jgi:Flp pilus assembly protein CpaB